jgi:hypothetical protein
MPKGIFKKAKMGACSGSQTIRVKSINARTIKVSSSDNVEKQ